MKYELSYKTLTFKKPARTSRGEYSDHRMLIITMTDDKGRCGKGECAPLPDLSCDAHEYDDISHVEEILDRAFAVSEGWRGISEGSYAEALRPFPALLFAVESALHEIWHSPELYDTPFARGEVGLPFNGLVWMASYDEMLSQMEQKIAQGFRCVKLKIGAIEWQKEMQLVNAIRKRFTRDEIEIRVDANGAFTPGNAMAYLEELSQYDIHSIEQPIRQHQWQEMARLCRETPLPIALDEELIGLNTISEKRDMLEAIRPQYVVIKPTLHGGMNGAREWARLAKKYHADSWITSALESNIGLRNVAMLAASIYGSDVSFPQGLGTGQLFVENINDYALEIRGARIFTS